MGFFSRRSQHSSDPAKRTSRRPRGYRRFFPFFEVLEDRILLTATSEATLGPLGEAVLGEPTHLAVTFDNTSSDAAGYGPFVDLLLPVTGADGAGSATDDGISFIGATYLGVALAVTTLTFDAQGQALHPLAKDGAGNPLVVNGTAGNQLVVLQLPFSGFTPEQPAASIDVTAQVSTLADTGVPLGVQARAGFSLGADPYDNPATDPSLVSNSVSGSITPTLFRLTKTYAGPENETATGPNFQRQYTVTVDLPDGQTVTNLDLTDVLPANLQFVSLDATTIQGQSASTTAISTPSTTTPGGTLTRRFASVTGTTSTNDATMTFTVYVPLNDASSNPVLNASTGAAAASVDDARAQGSWTPVDPRDPASTVTSDATPADHTLVDRSLAAQTTVAVVTDMGAAGPSPGDTLEYTVNLQVSDFFTFGSLLTTHVLPDGQRFDASFTPTLQVNGNPFTLPAAALATANYTVTSHYSTGDGNPNDGTDGTTGLQFRLSDEMVTRGQNGRLLGGLVDPAGGLLPSSPGDGPTMATLTFRTTIQENYTDAFATPYAAVHQGDALPYQGTVSGAVLSTSTFAATGSTVTENHGGEVRIVRSGLQKSIYAVNGSTTLPSPLLLTAGDTVTYRLRYDLPTGDTRDVALTDFLPLPVFDAAAVTTLSYTASATPPAVGTARLGPADTFHTLYAGITPTLTRTTTAGNNSVTFTYGDVTDPFDQSSVIEVLFTMQVSGQPYPDSLALTNLALSTEHGNTPGTHTVVVAQQALLTEPDVPRVTKGIVSTSNAAGTFSPAQVGPAGVTFSAPGASPAFTGTVTSSGLSAAPINSNLSGVDAGDLVRFAIVIENIGQGPNGAFDVRLRDTLPAGFDVPAEGLNLSITDGTGAAISYTDLGGGLFGSGLELTDPGPTTTPAGALDPGKDASGAVVTTGRNVAVITYDLELLAEVAPGQALVNTATLVHYASLEGGPGFTAGRSDTATVNVPATGLTKTLTATDQTFTSGSNLAIGEIATYQVTLTVPEGTGDDTLLVDTLPAGLALVGLDSLTVSTGLATSVAGGFATVLGGAQVGTDGSSVTLDFGTLTNANRDNATAETITLVYRVVALNVSSNQRGTSLPNQVQLTWDGGSRSAAAPATVVAPTLQLSHSVWPGIADAGDTVTFTLIVQHAAGSNAPAYDLVLRDVVPAPFTYVPGSLRFTGGLAPTTLDDTGGIPLVTYATLNVGVTSTIQLDVTIGDAVTAGQQYSNTATLTYTSLPGDARTPRSSYNSNSTERTGDTADPGGAANTFFASTTSTLTIATPNVGKVLAATDQAFTAGSYLAIGEVATYQATLTLPEGTSPSVALTDTLHWGLRIVAIDSLTSSPALSTSISGGFAAVLAGATIASDGSSLALDFGTVTNSDRSNAAAETITITYRSSTINWPSLWRGHTMPNAAKLTWTGGEQTSTVWTTLAAPTLLVSQSVNPPLADAGDVVTFAVTVAHGGGSNTDTFEVEVRDVLPIGLTYVPASLTHTAGVAPTSTQEDAGSWTAHYDVLPLSESSTFTFQATVADNVRMRQWITNTATATYTSLPGDQSTPRSPYYAITVERTGDPADPGGEANNLTASGQTTLTIFDPMVSKQVVATDRAYSAGTSVVIGEHVQYEVSFTVAEGATPTVTLTDLLPAGLAVLSLDNLTASAALSTSVAGGFAAVLVGASVGSGGSSITLPFGTLTNTNRDNGVAEVVTLTYTAVVLNVPGNQAGSSLASPALLNFSGQNAGGMGQAVTVIEPALQLTKTASATDGDAGGAAVTFTLTVTHAPGAVVDAFDLLLLDMLPPSLALVPGTLMHVGGVAPTSLGVVDTLLSATYSLFPLGSTSTLQFQATITADTTPGQLVYNTAGLSYTSLPGDVRTPQSAYHALSVERTGSSGDPGGTANDYAVQGTTTVRLRANSLAGSVYVDLDADGVRDPGEPGLEGVTLTLTGTDNLGSPVSTTTVTNASGAYSFLDLRPGTYTVAETQPAGLGDGQDAVGTPALGAVDLGGERLGIFTFPVGAENHSTGNTFGESPPTWVSGTVYTDANADGSRQQPTETGLAGVTITLYAPNGAVLDTQVSDVAGAYRFDGLTVGPYTLTVTPPGCCGPTTPPGLPVSVPAAGLAHQDFGLFACGLGAWTFTQSGGSTSPGTAVAAGDCGVRLREGDAFSVTLERTFVVPAQPSLVSLHYTDLAFDTTDSGLPKDAFEVALLDAEGRTLVLPFAAERDAVFNVTEGLAAALGTGAVLDGQTVLIDLAGLTPGSTVRLVVRLVNGDRDPNSAVQIDTPALVAAPAYLYRVPGRLGEYAAVTFTATTLGTTSDNEFGVVAVNDLLGRFGSLAPGATNYAEKALRSPGRLIVFPQGTAEGTQVTLTLAAGTLLLPYLVHSGTTLEALRDNPSGSLAGSPRAWFGVAAASADGYGHFLRTDAPVEGRTTWSVEEGYNGGDADFDDLVVGLTAAPSGPPPKFFVPDAVADATFTYTQAGSLVTATTLPAVQSKVRGAVSDRTGNRLWVLGFTVVGVVGVVGVYDSHGGLVGSWEVTDAESPQGIATDGTDVWIVEAGFQPRMRRYALGALRLSGTATASSTFLLHEDNDAPTDVTTDGTTFWVTDNAVDQVFVYDLTGTLLGRWALDPSNDDAAGITLNPAGGTDLWTVDRQDLQVYHYAAALPRRDGSQTAAGTFALAPGNSQPEGLADPCPACNPVSGPDSKGTDFWVLFPGSAWDGSPSLSLTIGAEAAATGTISIPGLEFSAPFSVGAGGTVNIAVPAAALLTSYDGPEEKGIHVTASAEVAVYGLSYVPSAASDAYTALPVDALGTDYVVMGYKNTAPTSGSYSVGPYTQFAVVATADNTVVTITPAADLGYRPAAGQPNPMITHAAGVPFTVALQRGETYQLGNPSLVPTSPSPRPLIDVTGTTITASQPIAVFAGHEAAHLTDKPGLTFFPTANVLVEQLPPTNTWRRNFVTLPFAGRQGGDTLRVLAAEDGTTVRLHGAVVARLDRGQYHQLIVQGPAHVTADKPVLVAQYAHGNEYDGTPSAEDPGQMTRGDPTMILVPGTDQYLSAYTIAAFGGDFERRHLQVVAPAEAVGQVLLDGVPIPAADFTAIGSSGYYGATVAVEPGTYQLSGPLPFNVLSYGFGQADAYGYPAGYSLAQSQPPEVTITSPDDGDSFRGGSVQLVTGQVAAGSAPVLSVTLNGVAVESLDAAGNFSSRVTLAPGNNPLVITAVDQAGQTATALVTVIGLDAELIRFDVLSDVTGTLASEYGRTSWDGHAQTLFAELSLRNSGDRVLDTPLLAAVRGIDVPTVALRDAAGYTPDGLPYYDFSDLVSNGTLAPEAVTAARSLAFYNPEGKPFTYGLVFYAQRNRPPEFTSVPGPEVLPNHLYAYDVTAGDADDDPVTLTLLGGPAGMTLDAAGHLRWTPAPGDVGTYTVVLQADDGRGGITEQHFVLAVLAVPPNRPPVFTSAPEPTARVGAEWTYAVTGTDADDDPLTVSLPAGPAGAAVVAGVVHWTPLPTEAGSLSLTVELHDGRGGTARQVFAVQVLPVAGTRPPEFVTTPVNTTALAGQAYRYTARAVDPDDDTLTYSVPVGPPGMSIDAVTGALAWAATGPASTHAVTVRVADGRGWTTEQSFTLTVLEGASAEVGGLVFTDADEDGLLDPQEMPLSGWVVYLDQNGNGVRDPGEASAAAGTDGSYALSGLAPGAYRVAAQPQTGRPPTVPAGGSPYAVDLVLGQAVTTLHFGFAAAVPANHPPSFAGTPPTSATLDTLLRYDPTASDADGDPLVYDAPVRPAGLAIDPASGAVAWRPSAGQAGSHDVLLRVRDGQGGVDLLAFTLTVPARNTPPVITSTPVLVATLEVPYRYTIQAQDADNDTLTYRFANGLTTESGGLTLAGNVLAFTPLPFAPPAPRPYVQTVNLVVSDGRGGVATQAFALAVLPARKNRPTVFTSTPRTETAPGRLFLYPAQVEELDADQLTYSLPDAPTGMEVDLHGVVSWTPDADQAGPHTVRLRVTDGQDYVAEQTFTLTVTAAAANRPPVLASAPALFTSVGQPYAYDARATDPDGDGVAWRLAGGPDGLSLDAERGTLRWTPRADQAGLHDVVLQAVDTLGAATLHGFRLTVAAGNRVPELTSVPPVTGAAGVDYAYAVRAADPEGQPLTFSLLTAPPGMRVDPVTGLVRWRPLAAGTYSVSVRVADASAAAAEQEFAVVVGAAVPNRPPVILSAPSLRATVGSLYAYQVVACDVDGDVLHYELRQGVQGITLDPDTGLLHWTPAAPATVTVEVAAVDPAGLAAVQRFTLVAWGNQAPLITSPPVTDVIGGQVYRYRVRATDPEGDALRFELLAGPPGLTLDEDGRLRWETTRALVQATPYPVAVRVTDPFGASASQSFAITVTADEEDPVVWLQVSPAVLRPTQPADFVVRASDNVGVTALTLTVGSTAVALDGDGFARMAPGGPGLYTVTATATDAAGNVGTATTTVLVLDPSDTNPPHVDITSPAPRAVLRVPTDLVGSVSDDQAEGLRWWVELWLADNPNASRKIAEGSGAVTDGVLAQLDPTALPNGSYVVRVVAVDGGGNDEAVVQNFQVAAGGGLKLGNFAVAFTDLTVPVAGIPITVTRVYDTLDAGRDRGVGFGWRLAFDPELQVELPPGTGVGWGRYPPFTDGTRVYVTLPGGQRQGFTFRTYEDRQVFGHLVYWRPYFEADAGNFSQLSVPEVLLAKAANGEYYTIEPSGLVSYNPADPVYGGTYTLTTQDGVAYRIAADGGKLLDATDRNGNRLTYTEEAITSNRGVAVTFERDAAGRITAVVDPRGNAVRYAYNAAGDLVSVTDRLGTVTARYGYRADRPHYLETITEADGVRAVEARYNAQGRLDRLMDADGNPVDLAYDVANLIVTATQPGVAPTVTTLDEHGNVVRQEDAGGGVTLTSYVNDLPTAVTRVVGAEGGGDDLTSTFTYDVTGMPLTATDPAGAVTRMMYNALNLPQTMSDPLGNTVHNQYDERGNLLETLSAERVRTAYAYDERGNLEDVTSGGATSHTDYNAIGWVTATTDAAGISRDFFYDANGNATGSSFTWVNPDDEEDERIVASVTVFDANDQAVLSLDAHGNATRTAFDRQGRAVRTIDSLGNATDTLYDARGLVIQTVQPSGLLSRTVYDTRGQVSYVEDPHPAGQVGRGTHTVYDDVGRVVRTERLETLRIDLVTENGRTRSVLGLAGAVLSSTQTVYNNLGQVESTTDAALLVTEYVYDAAGRQIKVLVGQTQQTVTEYDSAGRAVLVRDVLGHATRYEYDGDGRLVRTVYADGTSTSTHYDAYGRRDGETDQLGRTTNFEYDVQGHLRAVVQPEVDNPDGTPARVRPRTEYEYDDYGNHVLTRDANLRETHFAYNEFGQQVSRTLPGGATEYQEYDSQGRLWREADFKGQVALTSYDNLGRVQQRAFYAAGATEPGETVTYTHDVYGRQDTVTDSHGTTDYDYDADRRLIQIISPEGTIHYAYDPATGWHTRTWTAHSDISYGYDDFGRLETVMVVRQGGQDLPTPLVTTYAYNLVNLVETVEHPNGVISQYSYDALNQLQTLVHRDALDAVLASYTYTRSATGQITHVAETQRESDGSLSTAALNYLYDELARLTHEDLDSSLPGQDFATDYVLDLVGNRLAQTTTRADGSIEDTQSTYNARDELQTETVRVDGDVPLMTLYGWDDNGSLISKTSSDGSSTIYSFDLRNRLAGATITRTEGGVLIVEQTAYEYNADGIRSQEEVTRTIDGGTPITEAIRQLIDANNPTNYAQTIEEYTPGGLLQAAFIYGHEPILQYRGGPLDFYLQDGHSGVRLLTNGSAAITDRYRFDAYGILIASSGNTVNRLLYRGERFDPILTQYYLRARFYDPISGRFTTTDPFVGYAQHPSTLHDYVYTGADPVNKIDPSGREWSMASFTMRFGIGGALLGTALGAYFGFRSTGTVRGAFGGALLGAFAGFAVGAATGYAVGTLVGASGTAAFAPTQVVWKVLSKLGPQLTRIANRVPPQSADGAYRIAVSFLTGVAFGVVTRRATPRAFEGFVGITALSAYAATHTGPAIYIAARQMLGYNLTNVPGAIVVAASFTLGYNVGYWVLPAVFDFVVDLAIDLQGQFPPVIGAAD